MSNQEELFKQYIEELGLEREKVQKAVSGSSPSFKYNFEISPKEFLDAAEIDFANNDLRGKINAISNAKRAIHCQIDRVLSCFDIRFKNRKLSSKIGYLNEFGIITPRILAKLNKVRNVLEHEYRNPKDPDVELMLDIAQLFVGLTQSELDYFMDEYYIGNSDRDINGLEFSEELSVGYDYGNFIFHFTFLKDRDGNIPLRPEQIIGNLRINKKCRLYTPFIALTIAKDDDKIRLERAFDRIWSIIKAS